MRRKSMNRLSSKLETKRNPSSDGSTNRWPWPPVPNQNKLALSRSICSSRRDVTEVWRTGAAEHRRFCLCFSDENFISGLDQRRTVFFTLSSAISTDAINNFCFGKRFFSDAIERSKKAEINVRDWFLWRFDEKLDVIYGKPYVRWSSATFSCALNDNFTKSHPNLRENLKS